MTDLDRLTPRYFLAAVIDGPYVRRCRTWRIVALLAVAGLLVWGLA